MGLLKAGRSRHKDIGWAEPSLIGHLPGGCAFRRLRYRYIHDGDQAIYAGDSDNMVARGGVDVETRDRKRWVSAVITIRRAKWDCSIDGRTHS